MKKLKHNGFKNIIFRCRFKICHNQQNSNMSDDSDFERSSTPTSEDSSESGSVDSESGSSDSSEEETAPKPSKTRYVFLCWFSVSLRFPHVLVSWFIVLLAADPGKGKLNLQPKESGSGRQGIPIL